MNFATDELLASLGLKYEDLTRVERDSYNRKLKELEKAEITLTSWREHIILMKTNIELELAKLSEEDMDKKEVRERMKSVLARLKNYILLESFLLSPDRARQQIKAQLSNMNV